MRKICVLIALIAGCAFGCSSGENEKIILDVRKIANKSPKEVEKIAGSPDTTYTVVILGHPIFCQRYNKFNIEIQYPQSLATDIIVYGPHGLPFNQTALEAFNLDYHKQHPSDYMKDRFIRWNDFEEFSAISFYNPKKDSLDNIINFDIFFKVKEDAQ